MCNRIARIVCVFAALFASLQVSSAFAVTATYLDAAQDFERSLNIQQRIMTQVMLAAVGYTNHVPNVHFDESIFRAIQAFQSQNGYAPTGALLDDQLERLDELGTSKLDSYGFRKVALPGRSTTIWVPLGLSLSAASNGSGITLKDRRLTLYLFSFTNTSARDLYQNILTKERVTEHGTVHFQTYSEANDWFAISSSTIDGKDRYYRYHEDQSGVVGFTLQWDNSVENINAERIAVIMSASLGATMLGMPFIDPPGPQGGLVADPLAEQAQRDREQAHAQEERAEQQSAASRAERQAAIEKRDAELAKADAEAGRFKRVEIAKKTERLLVDKAAECARVKLRDLVKSGENAEVLASAAMTMCAEDIDHVLDVGVEEYKIEHEDTTVGDGVIREKMKAQTREQLIALAVQAKAGAGVFATTPSN